jgi:hypothetical protein
MLLIVYYIAILLLLTAATVVMGFAVEHVWGSVISLIVFLSLFFLSLWAAWVTSVWLTKPTSIEAVARAKA